MHRFRVDRVEAATERLPTRRLAERHPNAILVGGDPSTPVIDHRDAHPLLAAVGIAFAEHRPLVLSPDAIWLTIAQGFAQHVRLHADALRPRLVRHRGRQRLCIRTLTMPSEASGWAATVAQFRTLLAAEIGEGPARLFECDFSTSTGVDRLASQIVLLDVYAPYFSYWLAIVCGIPEITLLGTVNDWRRIRERIDVIAEFDLARWCRSLAPIADQFVRAARGDVDVAFWRRIYNPVDAYGGDRITGWITRLYPYVKGEGSLDRPNPMLELPIGEPKNKTTLASRSYFGPGLSSTDVPAMVSRVTVHIEDQLRKELRSVALVAGVTAVTQDDDGALRPIAGWHLEADSPRIGDIAEQLLREHGATPAAAGSNGLHLNGPAEVTELFHSIESATLFRDQRPWRLRSPSEHHFVRIEGAGRFSVSRIADLPDSHSLCVATNHATGESHWLTCRIEEVTLERHGVPLIPGYATAVDPPAEIRLLGKSLAAILHVALATDGDIDHLELGRLDELLGPAR